MARPLHLTLDQLVAAGLKIEQSVYTMGPGEWYCDGQGPFATPEAAVLAGIKRVVDQGNDYRPIWDDTSETAALRGAHSIKRRESLHNNPDDESWLLEKEV